MATAKKLYQELVAEGYTPRSSQLINALRGHLAEFGLMAPKGPANLKVLANALDDEATDLPSPVREMGTIYLDQIARLTAVIEQLADAREAASKTDTQVLSLIHISEPTRPY